jgi:hypothetical protein
MGQAIFAFTKFGFVADAWDLVQTCQAEEWWCLAMRGYVLHARGRTSEAEPLFREAMQAAPEEVRCSFLDASWLLGEWDQRRAHVDRVPTAWEETSQWGCERRIAVSDTLFWLGDALFSDDVNDRWVEHLFRAMTAEFSREIREAVRGSDLPRRDADAHWAMYVRRGVWDSFEVPLGRGPMEYWTSDEVALYPFLPIGGVDEAIPPDWNLAGNRQREGFTPNQGLYYPVQVQVARFRSAGSTLVLVSGDVRSTPLGRSTQASAFLVLSDGPGSFPVRREEELGRTNPSFSVAAPEQDHVLALEVVTRLGVGWHRQWLSALPARGPGVSDLLLFDPDLGEEPSSPEAAATAMLPSVELEEDAQLGLYFEVYGALKGSPIEFDLAVEKEPGSPAGGWRMIPPGSFEEFQGRGRWSMAADGGDLRQSLVLDPAGLGHGEFRLVLRVRWPGQDWLERDAIFRIEG